MSSTTTSVALVSKYIAACLLFKSIDMPNPIPTKIAIITKLPTIVLMILDVLITTPQVIYNNTNISYYLFLRKQI